VWDALRHFDPSRPVFIESESKKVGDLRVPLALVERMRVSPCIQLELALDARVALLIEDYSFFVSDTPAFCGRLDALRTSRGHAVVNAWQEAARAGRTPEVVRELLQVHYDPNYLQSMKRNFTGVSTQPLTLAWDGSDAALQAAAAAAIAAG
jgi:tRNA 2-selenouridine synthase